MNVVHVLLIRLIPPKAEILAFLRLFAIAVATQVLALDFKHIDRSALIGVIVSVLERGVANAWASYKAKQVAPSPTPVSDNHSAF